MKSTFTHILLVLCCCLIGLPAYSQKTAAYTLTGHVTDENGRSVDLAQVVLNDALATYTDAKGNFTLSNVPAGDYNYRIVYVGYKTETGKISITGNGQKLNVALSRMGLKLKGVTVTAAQVQMGSKSEIGQEAIRHLQPKSVGDLLQLMPGNLTQNPDLNTIGQAQIREIGTSRNNSLGTQVVVDGTPLSNDANLQVISPAKSGTSAGGGLSLHATAGRGVDLRTVSAGNVESMEVIRGIPGVEYGNLTSGVVIVKTKSGRTPWEAKVQADPNSKLAYVGKGFNLKGGGAINFSLDWAQSWGDTRFHYLGFDRVTASAGYSNQWGPLSFNVKGAFYSTVNNSKDDPQMEETRTHYKAKNIGARLSINGRWKPEHAFITSLSYDLSGQYANTIDKRDTWVTNPDGVVTTARESGVHVARFQNVGYQSFYKIDGKPINLYAQLQADKYIQLNQTDYNNIKLGAEYTYDGNKGKGFTYDENHPPQAQGTQTLRPRPFKDIPAMNSLSTFLSDKLAIGLPWHTRAQVEAGLRLSNLFVNANHSGGHNDITVLEPRVNVGLSILNKDNNSFFDDLSITGGYGISNKMPTLVYLYPDYAYFDNNSLSRFGSEENNARLALITTDVVKNTTNKYLKPTKNYKWELGLSFHKGKVNGFVTYFHERNINEYGFHSQLIFENYDRYDVPTDATNLVFDPSTNDVTYLRDGVTTTAARTPNTRMFTWMKPSNTSRSAKHGIEYGLDLGQWDLIKTSLNINGAWFHIKRKSQTPSYSLVYSDFDYVGLMPAGSGSVQDRVNTTFRFITHIPVIKVIFTTALQVVWYQSDRSIYEDENGNARYQLQHFDGDNRDYLVTYPICYFDKQQQRHEWQPEDANDINKIKVAERYMPYAFKKDVIHPWAMLNFRLTKEIGKVGEISFIANNLTSTKRWHTNKYSLLKTQLYPSIYYGAELKLKF